MLTATVSAAAITARNHTCAFGDEQCDMMHSEPDRGIFMSKYSKMSPTQSTGNSVMPAI
jgi:hypothetical protein